MENSQLLFLTPRQADALEQFTFSFKAHMATLPIENLMNKWLRALDNAEDFIARSYGFEIAAGCRDYVARQTNDKIARAL